MNIRPATPSDAPAISDIAAKSTRAVYEGVVEDETIYERPAEPEYEEGAAEWLATTSEETPALDLLAERADLAVGFLQLLGGTFAPDRIDPSEAYLKSLYVRPGHWNEGIGTALLEQGLEAIDASRVWVDVLRENERAKRFYEARGFEHVGRGTVTIDDATYPTARYCRGNCEK